MRYFLLRSLICCLVAFAPVWPGCPVNAQAPAATNSSSTTTSEKPASAPSTAYMPFPMTIGQVVAMHEAELAKLESELKMKVETLESVQQSINSGQGTAIQLTQAKEEAAQANASVLAAQARLQSARRLLLLSRPVDADFKDATLAQAVESLSKASGLKIASVSDNELTSKPGIPGRSTARLSVKAQGVPLAAVLETIAQTWGLLIAPDGTEGIVLRSLPVFEVNGKLRPVALPNYTWSDEWGIPPTFTGAPGYPGFGWGSKGPGMISPGTFPGGATMPQPGVSPFPSMLMPGVGNTGPKVNPGDNNPVGPGMQGTVPIGPMPIPRMEPGAFGPVMPFPYGMPGQGSLAGSSIVIARDRLDRLILVVADPLSGPGTSGCWLTPYEIKSDTGEIKKIGSSTFHQNSGIVQSKAGGLNTTSEKVTVMVYLKNAVADSVVWNLTHKKGALPVGVRIQPDVKKNAILVSGAPLDVHTATQAIELFDKSKAKRNPAPKKVKP